MRRGCGPQGVCVLRDEDPPVRRGAVPGGSAVQGRGAPGPPRGQRPRPCGQLLPPAPAALAGVSEGGGGGSGDRDKMTNESKWDEEALPSAMGGGRRARGRPPSRSPPPKGPRPASAQPPPTPHSRQAPSSTSFSLCSQAHLNYFSGEGGPPGGPALRPPVCTAPAAARDECTQVFAVHTRSSVVSQSHLVFFGMRHLYQTSPSLKCCLNESL